MQLTKDLEDKLKERFPEWNVRMYDVPDMWDGINVTTAAGSKFDVKVLDEHEVIVDHNKKVVQAELDLLVKFLKTSFRSVEPRRR